MMRKASQKKKILTNSSPVLCNDILFAPEKQQTDNSCIMIFYWCLKNSELNSRIIMIMM